MLMLDDAQLTSVPMAHRSRCSEGSVVDRLSSGALSGEAFRVRYQIA